LTNAPLNPVPGDLISMGVADSYVITAQPYTVNWFRLGFPEKYKYELEIDPGDGGSYSARPSMLGGTWDDLPDTIDTYCGAQEYTVVVTTATPGPGYDFEVKVESREREEACVTEQAPETGPRPGDCLLGRWELMTDSYAPYVQSIISHSQIAAHLDSATIQEATFDFDGNTGICTQTLVDDVVTLTQKGGGTINPQTGVFTPDVQIVVGVSGTVTPSFENTVDATTGNGTIIYRPGEGSLSIKVAINGEDSPVSIENARDLNYMSSERATYVCSGDTLIYTPDRGVSVEPLRFRRVGTPAPSP